MLKKILPLLISLISISLHAGSWTLSAEDARENPHWYQGITLLELLPLMEEVSQMTIVHGGAETDLTGEDLGEYWGESFLEETASGIILHFQNQIYPGVQALRWEGTPMESDELEIWLSWEGVDELKQEIRRFAGLHGIAIDAQEVPKPASKLTAQVRARGMFPTW